MIKGQARALCNPHLHNYRFFTFRDNDPRKTPFMFKGRVTSPLGVDALLITI